MPRYGFALYWSKTIWDKHVFLHVVIATDGCKVMGRHNVLAQKLDAKIASLVSLHCHAHRFASATYYTAANLYSMVYATAKEFLMQLWRCFTVSPLRSACLAMHQTTMTTKDRQLQRACKAWWLSSVATVKAWSEILAVWAVQMMQCALFYCNLKKTISTWWQHWNLTWQNWAKFFKQYALT